MTALASKPGLTNASVLSIPKTWDSSWFRGLVNSQLKGADVRNAVGVNGIKVSGTLASPYATIGFGAPVTLPSIVRVANASNVIGFDVFVNPTLSGDPPVMGNWTSSAAMAAIDLGNTSMMAYPNSGVGAGSGMYVMANAYYDGTNYIYKSGAANSSSMSLMAMSPELSGIIVAFYDGFNGTAGNPVGSPGTVVTNRWQMNLGGPVTHNIGNNTQGYGLQCNNASGSGFVVSGTVGGAYNNNTTLSTTLIMNSTGANFGQIGNVATQFWALGSSTTGVGVPGNIALEWGNTGAQIYLPGHTTTAATTPVCIVNNLSSPVGQLLRSTSSLRYKTNVQSIQPTDIDALLQMRPVTYNSICEVDDPTTEHLGFIAEEMALIDPRLVYWTSSQMQDGKPVATAPVVPEGVDYMRITVLLVGAIQTLVQRVAALEAQAGPLSLAGKYSLTGTNVVTTPSVVTVLPSTQGETV